jgi:hypothetical protein
LLACGLLACDAYDPKQIDRDQPEAPGQGDSGQAGSGDVAPGGTGGGSGSGGAAGAPDRDAGVDASAPDASVGCEPNPAGDAGACPEICPELCNGLDDDCDGEPDDGADHGCDAPHAVSVCGDGECLILECEDDHRDCDGEPDNGCEVEPTDPRNCGSCGKVCRLDHAIEACDDGECVAIGCDDGFADCDEDQKSCELSTRTLTDCGECGQACSDLPNATPTCGYGECEVAACVGLFGNCNGEHDDGCEEKLDSLDHCSDCDTPCEKASCSGGVCTAVLCASPDADCDRDEVDCEIDTSTDVDHCGGCDMPCAFTSGSPHATLTCVDSACGTDCATDFGDCDGNYQNGCEAPLLTTAAHCDGCGNDCATLLPHVATGSCSGGVCDVVTCDSGWEDCDGDPANGCERDNAALGPCHPDANCTKVVNGTHEYHFCTGTRTQADARARCRLQTRGDLVHIDNSTENAFVETHRAGNMWIGAGDAQREGTFRWLDDGVPFWKGQGSAGVAVLGRYANFDTNQPDNAGSGSGEDCVEIWAAGKWNDQPCGDLRGFVCEVRPDDCPSDPAKIAPGQCGCGNAETDADADSFAACADACESDVNKQAAGVCGCGAVEDLTNSDGDSAANCVDGCDFDPTKTTSAACLGFAPINFDPNTINWSAQPSSVLNCGTTTINTTDPDGTGMQVATISGWCGTAPVPVVQSQDGGPDVVIIPLRGLQIAASNSLRLIGNRPVILAVDGNISVAGSIDASGSGTTAGAGGHWSCGSSAGGNATGGDCTGGSMGGGGGGFGRAGGRGGNGGGGSYGAGGVARGSSALDPLFGGCGGGLGGGDGTDAPGGAGGGAVQLVASGSITVTGTVRANGAAGANGSCGNESGGGGGGSGGAIFFEATSVTTTGATIQVNGGRGGNSGSGASGGNGSTSSTSDGSPGGNDSANGGGGGGGGYGRVRTLDH